MSNKRTRLKHNVRREQILEAAIDVVKEVGYENMSRERVAARADVSTGQVSTIFGTMTQLRRAVKRYALHEIDKQIRKKKTVDKKLKEVAALSGISDELEDDV